jgi:formylglycine-generating enzyme required for sulfatase activity
VLALIIPPARADTFGSGTNAFTIAFVDIGNPGKADESYGEVPYTYRMGVTEAAQDWITKATASGLANVAAGRFTGMKPATNVDWYEAAAFVNWLNTSTGHQAAYDLTWTGSDWTMNLWSGAQAWQAGGENLFRHKDAYYFLPSEDEWYKAAYHKNDGVTTNHWYYPTGSDSIPDGIDFDGDTTFDEVFLQGFNQGQPNDVTNVGVASPYGTLGQGGNVFELNESDTSGPNDDPSGNRVFRGGCWFAGDSYLNSGARGSTAVTDSDEAIGFRVASVPEPSAGLLLLGTALASLLHCRRRSLAAK